MDPASGWTLNFATAISNTGWIAGSGKFDPDGAGGQAVYTRMFLLQIPTTVVPEPATIVSFGVALIGFGEASRRHDRRTVVTAVNQ